MTKVIFIICPMLRYSNGTDTVIVCVHTAWKGRRQNDLLYTVSGGTTHSLTFTIQHRCEIVNIMK